MNYEYRFTLTNSNFTFTDEKTAIGLKVSDMVNPQRYFPFINESNKDLTLILFAENSPLEKILKSESMVYRLGSDHYSFLISASDAYLMLVSEETNVTKIADKYIVQNNNTMLRRRDLNRYGVNVTMSYTVVNDLSGTEMVAIANTLL